MSRPQRSSAIAQERLAQINVSRDLILETCPKYGANDVALFGSVLRGKATSSSDLDLLVTFDRKTTLFDWIALEEELSHKIGRAVDVVSRGGLSRHIGPTILNEGVLL